MKISIYEIPNGYHARREGKPCKVAIGTESLKPIFEDIDFNASLLSNPEADIAAIQHNLKTLVKKVEDELLAYKEGRT